MDADITAAADSLALQRIQAQDYRDAAAAQAASNAAQAARDAASKQDADAWRAANLALSERQVAVTEKQAALLSTPSQEQWLQLYQMHMAVRLGPAMMTSNTPTNVVIDVPNDAVDMTVHVWPRVKAELDKLAAPSANS